MSKEEEQGRDVDRVHELFASYVHSREDGEPNSPQDLFGRAGEDRDELRRRVAVYEELQSLGATLGEANDRVDEPTPNRLGRYEILESIARTQLSRVYHAFDPVLGREVALKVFAEQLGGVEDESAWLTNEARALAQLDHAGVVKVFEVEEHRGRGYVAMEFLKGPSLADVLEHLVDLGAHSPMPVSEEVRKRSQELVGLQARCRLMADLARAVAYCHRQAIIHRDLKPGNVILVDNAKPKLIDFGLAHGTTAIGVGVTQRLMGTPAYIAPEQVDSGMTGADAKSDQFSFGVMLFETLTLRNPFKADSVSDTLRAISKAAPPRPRQLNPDVPTDLERVCLHCLKARPEERYPSMDHVARDLDAFLEHRAISLSPRTGWELGTLWLRRNRERVRLAATAALIVGAVLVVIWAYDGYGRRRQVRTDLSELAARAGTMKTPREFQAALTELGETKGQVGVLDRSLAHSGLFGEVAGDFGVTAERVAAAMLGVMSDERSARAERGLDYHTGPWKDAIALAHDLQPPSRELEAEYLRGRVAFPEAIDENNNELFQWVGSPQLMLPALQAVPLPDILAAGFYRLLSRDPNTDKVIYERDFLVSSGAAYLELELVRVSESHINDGVLSTLLLADVEGILPDPVDPAYHGPLPSAVDYLPHGRSWIARDPVTWAEVERFAEHLGDEWVGVVRRHRLLWQSRASATVQDDAPAVVSSFVAQEYALKKGARLPTVIELKLAGPRLGQARVQTAGLVGELSSTPSLNQASGRVAFVYPVESSSNPTAMWFRVVPEESFPQGYTFRLAGTL